MQWNNQKLGMAITAVDILKYRTQWTAHVERMKVKWAATENNTTQTSRKKGCKET